MLSRDERTKIAKEVNYFDIYLSIEHGTEVFFDEESDGRAYTIVEDEKIYLDNPEDYLRATYNEKIENDIDKYIKILMQSRGILSTDSITLKSYDVAKEIRRRNKRSSLPVSARDKEVILSSVISQHYTQLVLCGLQIISWAILRDSMFYFEGNNMLSRIDIDIPEKYWDDLKSAKTDGQSEDKLEEMLGLGVDIKFEIKRNNPLEISVAMVTQLANENEKFSDAIGQLVANIMSHMNLNSEDDESRLIDDAGLFRTELRGNLPKILRERDSNK